MTAKGIIAIDGIYEKEKCGFKTELSKDGVAYINVYKMDMQVPFRFKVLEKGEEVVQIVSQFN